MINRKAWVARIFLTVLLAAAARAQVQFKTIFTFDGTDGVAPKYMFLIQGTDGNFYGTTTDGGADGVGTIFKITPGGQQTVLYSFCPIQNGNVCPDGGLPYAGVIQATDGNFYGTTYQGGLYGQGVVFRMTPAGVLTTLYSFCPLGFPCLDGASPAGGLIQGSDGDFYGTTSAGGTEFSSGGTVFKISSGGDLTTLYSFCSVPNTCPDGETPFAGLIQNNNGNFYGSTAEGNIHGGGTVFEITPTGVLTTLYDFCSLPQCADGFSPRGLAQGPDGNFYGTTVGGGTTKLGGQGTVFKITPAGGLTTIYTFCQHPVGNNCPDSGNPQVGLTLASNGYFAGTTPGAFHGPTIFGIGPTGGKFEQYTQAANTSAGLLQSTSGIFYGMAGGGNNNNGSIFSLSVGLLPFVKTTPVFGPVATSVIILGTNLTGATSVTFNGTPAQYTVVSASEITTSVPAGASSGSVKVKTPKGTLVSNLPFTVQ